MGKAFNRLVLFTLLWAVVLIGFLSVLGIMYMVVASMLIVYKSMNLSPITLAMVVLIPPTLFTALLSVTKQKL